MQNQLDAEEALNRAWGAWVDALPAGALIVAPDLNQGLIGMSILREGRAARRSGGPWTWQDSREGLGAAVRSWAGAEGIAVREFIRGYWAIVPSSLAEVLAIQVRWR